MGTMVGGKCLDTGRIVREVLSVENGKQYIRRMSEMFKFAILSVKFPSTNQFEEIAGKPDMLVS